MTLGLFHFQVLYEVLEKIHYIYDEQELADTILTKVSEALNAEGGSIFKILPDETILPLASYGAPLETLKKMTFKTGKGVVGWVAQYAQPVKVDNPQQDTRFMGTVDSNTGFKTKSIVASPILTKGRPVGVIEFLNRKGGPFAIPDLELISMVGREIGIAFENVRLIQNLEKSRAFQESIVTSLSAGVLVTDMENRILTVNPSARRILGIKLETDEEKPPMAAEALRAFPELVKILEEIAGAGGAAVSRKEVAVVLNGRPSTIGYSAVPLKTKDGKCLGTALLFQDITAFIKPG